MITRDGKNQPRNTPQTPIKAAPAEEGGSLYLVLNTKVDADPMGSGVVNITQSVRDETEKFKGNDPSKYYYVEVDGVTYYRLPSGVMVNKETYSTHVGRMPFGSKGEKNQLVIPSNLISMTHCLVYQHQTGVYAVKDLGSSNGTYVNGHKISQPTKLDHGVRINLADAVDIEIRRMKELPGRK